MQFISRLRRYTGTVATLIVAATLVWTILLPGILRTQLSARLVAMGMTDATFELEAVTPFGLRFYDVRLAAGCEAPRIGSLTVRFTPWGLMHKQIDHVIVRDAVITIQDTGNGWSVAGLSLAASPGGGSAIVQTLELRSASVSVASGQQPIEFAVQGEVHYNAASGGYDLALKLPISGRTARLNGEIVPEERDATFRFSGKSLPVAALAALAGRAQHADIEGALDVSADARLRAGALSALNLSIATPGLAIPGFETGPLTLRVNSVTPDRLTFGLARANFRVPYAVTIEDTHGVIERASESSRWSANLESRVSVSPGAPLSTTATARVRARARWPPDEGRLAEISISPENMLSVFTNLSVTVRQAPDGVSIRGDIRTAVDELVVGFSGLLGTGTTRSGSATLQQFQLSSLTGEELHLLPAAIEAVHGMLSISGAVYSAAGRLRSGGTLALRDASLTLCEPAVVLHGANADVELLDLLSAISDGGQTLTFERLEIGSVKLKNGRLTFQIESPRSFFAENFSAAWAGGHIQALATRFDPFKMNVSSFIYVDKIDLVRLFSEVMGMKVVGKCLISGKIEGRYGDGGLRHISGELHSVPGSGGDLLFEDAPNLAGGIPLIEEALKDFHYRWARLDFTTTDDALDLEIKLQGQPNRDLPLVFDKKAQTYVRDITGRHSATLEELQIVLRFRSIPLELFGNESLTGALLDALQKPEVKQ